uniref:Transposase Tnp1/En/Spm-like domain-containing protein n=1 Tax=Triticum urartu TaxID=4572 RepID=A0A8R7RAU6_TRIUA
MLTQKGKDVIFYNVYRDNASPVAKAIILSIDRRKLVGGQELGLEYCEVVVNYVIKRDAILPRGIGNMNTMGQAQGRCIA